jgi:hypothetical protein
MAHAVYREAKTPQSKGKRLHHLEVHRGEDGGHRIVHHYHDDGMAYHPPKEHLFGKDEGPEVMAHIAKHAQIEHEPESDAEMEEG